MILCVSSVSKYQDSKQNRGGLTKIIYISFFFTVKQYAQVNKKVNEHDLTKENSLINLVNINMDSRLRVKEGNHVFVTGIAP